MATNSYFNYFNSENEQNLIDDIIVEYIKQFGADIFYLPRKGINEDEMLTDFQYSEFNQAIPVEMYVKNFDSFEGEGQLLSKFGLEIRDQMTLVLSIRSFKEFIQPITGKERPLEGDAIYIPFIKGMYQIKFVNTSAIFYTLGKLNTYEIICELFEHSNEQFETGIPEIDEVYRPFDDMLTDPDYAVENYDKGASNKVIQKEADKVLDLSEFDPFGGGNI